MKRWLTTLVLAMAVAGAVAAQTPPPNPGGAPQPGAPQPGAPMAGQPAATYEGSSGVATFTALAGAVLVLIAVCYPSRRY